MGQCDLCKAEDVCICRLNHLLSEEWGKLSREEKEVSCERQSVCACGSGMKSLLRNGCGKCVIVRVTRVHVLS